MKVVNSFMGMTDMVDARVLKLEKLEKVRRPIKNTHIIYFVEPTQTSFNFIKNDFDEKHKDRKKGDNTPEAPLYDFIHLLFSGPVDLYEIKDL